MEEGESSTDEREEEEEEERDDDDGSLVDVEVDDFDRNWIMK